MDALQLLEPGTLADRRPSCPYEGLIGSWDVVSRSFAEDGSTSQVEGEWHFGWILGGWGVQDVLFLKGAPADERGTSIRCYDPAADVWRVVWMEPWDHEFAVLDARRVGDRIVQEGEAMDGSARVRWTFSDLTADGFVWRGERSLDGGASWRLGLEMHGTRRP